MSPRTFLLKPSLFFAERERSDKVSGRTFVYSRYLTGLGSDPDGLLCPPGEHRGASLLSFVLFAAWRLSTFPFRAGRRLFFRSWSALTEFGQFLIVAALALGLAVAYAFGLHGLDRLALLLRAG